MEDYENNYNSLENGIDCLLRNRVRIKLILACLAALRGCLLWDTFWLISPRTALPLRDWRAPLFLPDTAGRACKFSCHTTLDLDELNKTRINEWFHMLSTKRKLSSANIQRKLIFPTNLLICFPLEYCQIRHDEFSTYSSSLTWRHRIWGWNWSSKKGFKFHSKSSIPSKI